MENRLRVGILGLSPSDTRQQVADDSENCQ